MNNDRRRELDRIRDRLEQALSDLESVQAEEEDCRDRMPEGSEQYARSEDASANLDEAIDGLNTVIDAATQATE